MDKQLYRSILCWKVLTLLCLSPPTTISATANRGIAPIFIWHGVSECDEADSTVRMKTLFESQGALVKTVRIGPTCTSDTYASIFMDPEEQVKYVCTLLTNDPDMKNGFTVFGMSQGGLMARALVQICPTINVTNLITAGGPHAGTFGLPACVLLTSELFRFICDAGTTLQTLVGEGRTGLTSFFRLTDKYVVPTNYWVDPLRATPMGNFIDRLNNRFEIVPEYKENLLRLKNFIAIWFNFDTTVYPFQSGIFGEYKRGSETEILPFNETDLYIEDRIGLRELHQTGRFIPIEHDGLHMNFTLDWFTENIIEPYLVGQLS